MRRLRRTPALRRLVREARLDPSRLVWPLFVHGHPHEEPVMSMPDVHRHPVTAAPSLAEQAESQGLGGVLLFGLPDSKDPIGSSAYHDEGIVQRTIREMKDACPNVPVITDVCLCQYTSHGHCGVLEGDSVDNDATLEILARVAVSHARAGADIVAPSDMMDGRVGVLRDALDSHGFEHVPILSYAAKYASGFYGPFREAADSAPHHGDRRGYQMDPGNAGEALREVELDLEEGADIIMIKPALPYLDVIRRVKEKFGGPIAAYQVSGEYAMIRAAGKVGAIDERRVMHESVLAIHRAGADIVATYDAPVLAKELAAGEFD